MKASLWGFPALPHRPSGDPGPVHATLAPTEFCGRTAIMAAMPKPKPQPADEAREQLRRALQTSMDTRQ